MLSLQLLVVVAAISVPAQPPVEITGIISTCANGEVRPVRGTEVYLFRGSAAAEVREHIVAAEHVMDSDEAYRTAFARLQQAVRETDKITTRTDREGKFRFDVSGELVLVLDVRKRIFNFAFVKGEAEGTLWLGDVAEEECGSKRPSSRSALSERALSSARE